MLCCDPAWPFWCPWFLPFAAPWLPWPPPLPLLLPFTPVSELLPPPPEAFPFVACSWKNGLHYTNRTRISMPTVERPVFAKKMSRNAKSCKYQFIIDGSWSCTGSLDPFRSVGMWGIYKFGAKKSFGRVLDVQKCPWKAWGPFSGLELQSGAQTKLNEKNQESRQKGYLPNDSEIREGVRGGALWIESYIKSPLDREEGPVGPWRSELV